VIQIEKFARYLPAEVANFSIITLDREAGAAAARGGRLRVGHPERRPDEVVDEIDLRAGEKAERNLIDNHLGAGTLQYHVVVRGLRHEVELVLEARAPAALDADAEGPRCGLAGDDLGNALGGALGDGDGFAHHGLGLVPDRQTCGRMESILMQDKREGAEFKAAGVRQKPGSALEPAANENDRADYGASLGPGQRSPGAYSAGSVPSRGRFDPEPECTTRSPFQRDRDRILHSTAFRRLTHKTQVFVFHEGDHYRTRLTHSLEVAQIARTVARQLRLDEDLAEAIALAHDLGHPPFGHAGERALDAAMADFGGFDHNAQSLRVVTSLERKYAQFDGLNLTWEALEGLAKHNGPVTDGAVAKVARRIEGWRSLELSSWPSAEAQVAALADDIAYVSHDIDDGLRAHLIVLADLEGQPLTGPALARVHRHGGTDEAREVYELTRMLITQMISDLVTETRTRLATLKPRGPDDIRRAPQATVAFSPAMASDIARLKAFLFERVYRHERVMSVMHDAERVVGDLFARYMAEPAAMAEAWHAASQGLETRRRARLIGDFVAGMTDRYAMVEHRRLFDATPDLR
jgi:dGTPase